MVVTGPLGPVRLKGLLLVRTKVAGAAPAAVAVTVYWPAVPLAVGVHRRLPIRDDRRGRREGGRGAIRGRHGEADDAAVDRLDRVLGRHRDGQRLGERRADHGRLRRAAGDGREGEALALEGADVDVAGPRLARAGRWPGRRARPLPPPIAGLPGSRAMVEVGPP